jgi:hypothetical protein
MYSSIEDSEVVLVFECNNAGLKKLSSVAWTDMRLICLSKCHMSLKYEYVLNCEEHFFIFHEASVVAKCKPIKHSTGTAFCFLVVGCLAYSPTLKMKAACSSETSVNYETTPRHISEDSILQSHHRDYFKSNIRLFVCSCNLTILFSNNYYLV